MVFVSAGLGVIVSLLTYPLLFFPLIVVPLAVLLRATFTPAGEVPTIGGYGILRTLTGSMEPAIPVHSLVVVQQADPAELQVGDIITFEATEGTLDGALNTHRIVQIDEGSAGPVFHTKGDANAVEDAQTVSAAWCSCRPALA